MISKSITVSFTKTRGQQFRALCAQNPFVEGKKCFSSKVSEHRFLELVTFIQGRNSKYPSIEEESVIIDLAKLAFQARVSEWEEGNLRKAWKDFFGSYSAKVLMRDLLKCEYKLTVGDQLTIASGLKSMGLLDSGGFGALLTQQEKKVDSILKHISQFDISELKSPVYDFELGRMMNDLFLDEPRAKKCVDSVQRIETALFNYVNDNSKQNRFDLLNSLLNLMQVYNG